ncbi:MAG TPA: hypothetical protein DDW52_22680 [Planctomycetaceae bacterium]|nr:hypothetical protein [Planctomycetaceae bacterium]
MALALTQTCARFDIEFAGNLEPLDYSPSVLEAASAWRKTQVSLSPRRFHARLAKRAGWQVPERAYGLACCIRPWVYDELFLASITRPVEYLCAIDGISPRSPDRKLNGKPWRGLDAPFRDLPSNLEIHCPDYLESEAKRLGEPKCIPKSVEASVFSEYRQTPIASEFAELLGNWCINATSVAFIFSQQLSQCGYLEESEEVPYYMMVVDALKDRGIDTIIFKQHPRDPAAKISELTDRIQVMSHVHIVPPRYACVPIEPFGDQLASKQLVGASSNSTALLSFRALTDATVFSVDSACFTDGFRQERDQFCQSHGVELIAT